MAKNFFFRFGLMLILVIVAALWLLSEIPATAEMFSFFNFQWAIVIACGGIGVFFLFRSFAKNITTFKKFYLFIGIALILAAVLVIVNIFALPDSIVIPLIALIAAVGLLLGVMVTGGKRWDTGDNKKVGYKNYHQRKAEEEKNRKEE
jgi:hypothetical protein